MSSSQPPVESSTARADRADQSRGSQPARVVGLIAIIAGVVFALAGVAAYIAVQQTLSDQQITVSDDASAFQGQLVDTPWEAWVQADIINTHALASTDGQTYAELDQDDPRRSTVMTASFLRASLFTSVVAFGVALLVFGIGVSFVLIGWALRKSGTVPRTVVDSQPAPPATANA